MPWPATEQCLAAGMDDYLSKPVNFNELVRVLQRWLKKHESLHGDAAALPAAEPEQQPILDKEALRQIAEDLGAQDPTLVAGVISDYLQQLPRTSDALLEAMNLADPDVVRQLAHKLKGSSQIIGARALAAVCGDIERLARVADLDSARKLTATFRVRAAQTGEAVRSLGDGKQL